MKYFLYDASTGDIALFTDTPEALSVSYIPGLDIISAEGHIPGDEARYKIVNQQIVPREAQPVFVSAYQIREKRDELELLPISVSGFVIDCDTKSEMRMRDCLDAWDILPFTAGQFEDVGGEKTVFWVLANNTKVGLTKQQLEDVYTGMLQARAVRGAKIFAAYQAFKVRTDVTLEELNDSSNWV